MAAIRTPATDRIGDVLGIAAALVGTLAAHLFMFGGEQYFALRFLFLPVDSPIAFAAFWISVVLLVVAIVRATRSGAWSVLAAAGPRDRSDAEGALAGAEETAGARPPRSHATPGAVTRRALRAAAIVSVVNALFMIVFVIAVIPMFAMIFLIAAALIAGVYIVLRATEPPTGTL